MKEKELMPCPWCGGYAELEDDTDGSLILKAFHDGDCPACAESDSTTWQVWFYEDDFMPKFGTMREQVVRWWNRRDGKR